MKIASLIFAVVGIAANAIMSMLYMVLVGDVFYNVFLFLSLFVTTAIAIIIIVTLFSGRKKIALGVLGIIFVNPLCGIFYLCWRPEQYVDYTSHFNDN